MISDYPKLNALPGIQPVLNLLYGDWRERNLRFQLISPLKWIYLSTGHYTTRYCGFPLVAHTTVKIAYYALFLCGLLIFLTGVVNALSSDQPSLRIRSLTVRIGILCSWHFFANSVTFSLNGVSIASSIFIPI